LHFLPLARIFRIPVCTWIGLFTVLAVGSLLALDVAVRAYALGLIMAMTLWLTAAVVLMNQVGHWLKQQGSAVFALGDEDADPTSDQASDLQ
jgi:hypothetical protein